MKKAQTLVIAAFAALTLALTGCGNDTATSQAVSSDGVFSEAEKTSDTQSFESKENSDAQGSESDENSNAQSSEAEKTSDAQSSETASPVWETAQYKEDTDLGEGKISVKIEVKADGKSVTLTVRSDNDNLEKILTENKLVEGDESEFGLYIKKVNGIRADYDADKAYWALSKNGEATATGASGITVSDGEHYEFVYTPA